MQIFKNPNFDFVRWRWPALFLSIAIIATGLFLIGTRGLQKGVDFEGGTIVILKFAQAPDMGRIQSAVGEATVQRYGPADENQIMVRVKTTGQEAGGSLSNEADRLIQTLQAANVGSFERAGTKIVGPIVGEQLRRQGIWATVLALGGILVYIALRFQFTFAVGAVVATVHDLLICLSFLAFFGYDMTLNVIAGLLTITGYSVNDTIVVFDRVRENMRSMRRDHLAGIVNTAVNQTLSRTVITAGTTLLSVVALYLFGGEVLEGFAFTMMIGIISGTYSTVFIASSIAIMLQRGKAVGRGQGTKGQPAPATPPAAVRPSRRRAS